MGAQFEEITIIAKNDAELTSIFSETIKQCQWDFGHAGYTGTFAEKQDVKILPPPENREYWELEAITEIADDADKWGPAIAGKIGKNKYFVGGYCSS